MKDAFSRIPINRRRRQMLRYGFCGVGILITGSSLWGYAGRSRPNQRPASTNNIPNLGPLGEPDENGVRLPAGFTSRIVARSGQPALSGAEYTWHPAPDGGATFPVDDGGWVYVSNSEMEGSAGGVGALRFDVNGNLIDAYPLLQNTNRNCAGGPTPWGTWLSCEEVGNGQVWECDPLGRQMAVVRPALGTFRHEAAAVDSVRDHLYLTEDRRDGRFYRFTADACTPFGFPDLSSGKLEVARVIDSEEGQVVWHGIPDPLAFSTPTRRQVPESTSFNGGEGIWYHNGIIYFATTGDARVWAYNTSAQSIVIIYDDDLFENAELTDIDNITVSSDGDVLVADASGDMQIVAITPQRKLIPIVQVVGHISSEIAGPAFTPLGDRLYFSSQRGETGSDGDGLTFEITGPFLNSRHLKR